MEFSIVVPVYNEAGNIFPLLQEINRAVPGRGAFEVIYVDDGSDDGTHATLQCALDEFSTLRVLSHPQRSGQSSALLTGVRAARAPRVITLDGDGQNDPADIGMFLDRITAEGGQAGDLLLVGHRTRRRDTRIRRWSSHIANAVRSRLLQDGTPDTGCGLKLFPRDLFLSLPAFDHMHRFLPALMQRAGARVISVPVRHRARQIGESKYGVQNRLWVGLVDMAGVMWLQRRRSGQPVRRDGLWSRLVDTLGVYWLQRRPCSAPAREEC
ncbi:MAG: glycosyltransferase family 2 protein [Gammaproteobacteria bacterium]|nr:MAG: glycosyltransferase family 2 protein [Gammaproteobacteria bacterium]